MRDCIRLTSTCTALQELLLRIVPTATAATQNAVATCMCEHAPHELHPVQAHVSNVPSVQPEEKKGDLLLCAEHASAAMVKYSCRSGACTFQHSQALQEPLRGEAAAIMQRQVCRVALSLLAQLRRRSAVRGLGIHRSPLGRSSSVTGCSTWKRGTCQVAGKRFRTCNRHIAP